MFHEKEKFIPQSLISRFLKSISNVIILCNNFVTFPTPVFAFKSFIILLQSSYPCLLVGSKILWQTSDVNNNLMRFMQYFYRFYSHFYSEKDFTNNIIIIAVFTVFFTFQPIANYIGLYRSGKLSRVIAFLSLLFFVLVLPMLITWCSSLLATLLYALIEDSTINKVTVSIEFVVCLIILVFLFLVFLKTIPTEPIYEIGKSFTWSSQVNTIIFIFTSMVLFFSRLAELYNGITAVIFIIVLLLIMITYLLFLYIFQPFIDSIYQNLFTGVVFGFTIGLILQLIHAFVPSMYTSIIFYGSILLSVVGVIISNYFQQRTYKRVKETLDALSQDEIDFNERFSNPTEFLVYARIGFQQAHPYVLSWKPFILAINRWPTNVQLWIQYIKFIVIYYDEKETLNMILMNLKTKKLKSIFLKLFVSQIRFIQEGRNQSLTKSLKSSLKSVEEEISQIRNLIVIYWNSIQDCSINSTYNICTNLQKSIDSCISKFSLLTYMWPTNYVLAKKFADFYEEVAFDPKSAHEWRIKEAYLHRHSGYHFDRTQELGFVRFPLLPHDIRSINPYIPEIETGNNTVISNSSSIMSSADVNAPLDIENEVPDFSRSNIQEMAKSTNHLFMNRILILIYISILAFNILALFPIIFATLNSIKLGTYSSTIDSLCSVFTNFSTTAFFTTHSLFQKNNYPIIDLGADDTFLINAFLTSIDSYVHYFQNSITNEAVGLINNEFLSSFRIPLQVLNDTIQSTIIESLNYFNGLLYHNITSAEAINSTFLTIFENSYNNLQEPIYKTVEEFTADAISLFGELFSMHMITSSVCLVVMIICIIPLIKFILNIKEHWTFIIKTLNSIPRVAIQKVIHSQNKSSNDTEEQLQKDEFKYHYLFINMASSRSTINGIPITQLIIFVILLLILSIIASSFFSMYIRNSSSSPTSSILYVSVSNSFETLFYVSNFLLRANLSDKVLIYEDTKDSIRDTLMALNLSNLIEKFLYNDWNGYHIGLFFSNIEMMDKVLEWDGKFDLDNFYKLPKFVLLQIAKNILVKYRDYIGLQPNYDPATFDDDLDLGISILGSYLPANLMPEIQADLKQLYNDSIYSFNFVIFLGGILFFVVGIVIITLIFNVYYHILHAFQTLLGTLSMIEPDYYKDLPNVMKLYSGVSEGKVAQNQNIINSYSKVESEIPESIFELDQNFNLIKINTNAMKLIQLEDDNIPEQTHINLYITFEDNEILTELKKQVTHQTPQKISFLTQIRINSTNKIIETKLTSIYVPNDKVSLILILSEENNNTIETQQIQELEQRIKTIKIASVPEKLKYIFTSDKRTKISSDFSFIITIDLCNFSDYCLNHSSYESIQYFERFNNQIELLCNQKEKDLVNLSPVGNTFLLSNNLSNQTSNYYNATIECIRFVFDIYDFAINNGYQIKCCIVMNKNVVSAVSTNRIGFFVYSSYVHFALNALHSVDEGNLIITKKIFELLPQNLTKNSSRLQIDGKGVYLLDLKLTRNS